MLFELRQAVDAFGFTQKQIAECDRRLKALLAELPEREVIAGAAEDAPSRAAKRRDPDETKRTCQRSIGKLSS